MKKNLIFIGTLLSISVFVFLVINYVCGVSFRLLLCDIRSRFVDNRLYLKLILIVFLLLLIFGFYLWQAIYGKAYFRWNIRICKRDIYLYNGVLLCNTKFMFAVIIVLVISIMSGILFKGGQTGNEVCISTNLVGHSFGRIEGYDYTGSLEALELNYAEGHRIFEVDIILTSDGEAVLKHDWNYPTQYGIDNEHVPTKEQFVNTPILEKYTALTFEDLCKYMISHPEIMIVTDTKYTEETQIKQEFDEMVKVADSFEDSSLYDRFIVQIYNEAMYEQLKGYNRFDNYIFTMYQRWGKSLPDDMKEVSRYCVNNNIFDMAMSYNLYDDELQKIADRYGINIYLHTVNEIADAEEFLKRGVKGFYTDNIKPRELEVIK